MTRFVLLFVIFAFAFPAYAQQSIESLCQDLAVYVPIDGVEYDPGATDIPADLNSVQDVGTGSITIPVEIDLAEYFDRPELQTNSPGLLLRPQISDIVVNQDGSIFYNGQEISQDVLTACGSGDEGSEEKPVVVSKPKPSVQPSAVKSRVRVTNGDEVVISGGTDAVKAEGQLKSEKGIIPLRKPARESDNSIDVEVLNAQDNTDQTDRVIDDQESILEGQYP